MPEPVGSRILRFQRNLFSRVQSLHVLLAPVVILLGMLLQKRADIPAFTASGCYADLTLLFDFDQLLGLVVAPIVLIIHNIFILGFRLKVMQKLLHEAMCHILWQFGNEPGFFLLLLSL